jgi:NAD(P)H-dependent FMN reductase
VSPRILVFAGSIRTGSFNARLAALAAKELTRAEAAVSLVSLGGRPPRSAARRAAQDRRLAPDRDDQAFPVSLNVQDT